MSELIDNSRGRVELLKEIIKELHDGVDPQLVKAKLTTLVQATSSEEIVTMEQQLIADGMSIEEIKGMCDLHQQVTSDLMIEPAHVPMTPGHPVHTFRLENEAIGKVTAEMRALLAGEIDVPRWRALHERLLEVEKHYARKENILFPHLERHGVLGPSKVMWGKDDDIRAMLRALREALAAGEAGPEEWRVVADQIAAPMLDQIDGMIVKEESILFPLALGKLTPEEWGAIWDDSRRFGYCLVEPGALYTPVSGTTEAAATTAAPSASAPAASPSRSSPPSSRPCPWTSPSWTRTTASPSSPRASTASSTARRRSSAARCRCAIRRRASRSWRRSSATSAPARRTSPSSGSRCAAASCTSSTSRLRGAQGEYLGTLEVTQDATRLRALAGERRLLQYEGATS